jgi:hypothetical protein
MGYLIEIDLLRSRIAFPQPDETSPFHPHAGRKSGRTALPENTLANTEPPRESPPSGEQEEFRFAPLRKN